MGRAGIGWSAQELARRARVGFATVTRFEGGQGVTVRTLSKLESALEKEGVIFILRDASGGPGVRLKR